MATPTSKVSPPTVDAERLVELLDHRIAGEVRFDRGSRALYATDASNYRQVPIGVVLPRTKEDIVATVGACREVGAPILGRGGGTSLGGQCCNVAVVVDCSKYMHRVLEIDPEARLARVEPGCVLDDLRDAANEHGLTFGPDPATHDRCTLGGMIGNNSCGVHSVMAGRTVDNVRELEVLTPDGVRMWVGSTSDEELERIVGDDGRRGEIYSRLREIRDAHAERIRDRYPQIPRRVSGYNLDELLPERGFHVARALVGTESTCVLVLEAVLELVPAPMARTLVVLGYPSAYEAGDHVPEILQHGPIGLEGIDRKLIAFMDKKGLRTCERQLLPDGDGFLLVEFGGDDVDAADAKGRAMMDALAEEDDPPTMKLFDDPEEEKAVWEVRESGLGATARVPGEPDAWPGWEDAAVPPTSVGAYLREFRALLDRYGYDASLYGHFGDGCIHCRITFDLQTASGIQRYRSFVDDAADLVLSHGGSLSGEHGDGQARGELLAKMYGPELVDAFREFKRVWDPEWRMNPGKVVDADPIVANLRLGADFNPWRPRTRFAYPADGGDLPRATLRCVGVGKCRRTDGGTMCPSYMVTREEAHSTRGRAHLLFEMLEGEVITDGWRSEEVKEALDLCLSCKGCKSDCPVDVDIATYKAEFLSHYYSGRLRPPAAYSMGLIFWWARIASRIPHLANAVMNAPVLSDLIKAAGGISVHRSMPPFAPQTFTQWWRRRLQVKPDSDARRTVVLWPDTFNNHLRPATAVAAAEVLEAAGYRVWVPEAPLCCGRPLYDFGFLGLARRLLRQCVEALRPFVRAGIPVVGIEPSCLAVFRDELVEMFPDDDDARRLSENAFTLGELLSASAGDFDPPRLQRHALMHGHCHHKSIMGTDGELELLRRMGLELQTPETGCCGMAGSFGFEAEKYDVSVACGERVLLPAVREAAESSLIVADGFSCREQIRQHTDREALHLAQVLQLALRCGPKGQPVGRPEAAGFFEFVPRP